MLAVGGLPVFNVVVVKFYINCMVAINRCMIVLVLILIYTSLTVNYSYLRIFRLTMWYISFSLSLLGYLSCTAVQLMLHHCSAFLLDTLPLVALFG